MIQINSVNYPPSEALNLKIEQKLNRVFSRYPFVSGAIVYLKKQDNEPEKQHVMEIRVSVPNGNELFVEAREETPYNALDRNVEKLRRQLSKYKQRTYSS